MKVFSFISLFLSCLLLSCTNQKDKGIITYQLSKSDYIEKIGITGTVQAVVNHPVLPPRSMYGQMTVVRLAEDGAVVSKGDTICILTVPELESKYREIKTSIENLEAELKKKRSRQSA